MEPNERLTLENIIVEACQDNVSNFPFQEMAGLIQEEPDEMIIDEELFDDSDADPNYIEESESDSDTEIPNKRLKISYKKKTRIENDQAGNHDKELNDEKQVEKHIETVKKKPGRRAEKNESRKIRDERKKNRNFGFSYR